MGEKETSKKEISVWVATDKKGQIHLWHEGRYAVYSATHGKDVSLQRSKQGDNFVLKRGKLIF